MQKIRKILRAVSEKTALPTNQPTYQLIITNNTNFIGLGWRRSKNIIIQKPGKGNSVVIADEADYLDETENLLNDNGNLKKSKEWWNFEFCCQPRKTSW